MQGNGEWGGPCWSVTAARAPTCHLPHCPWTSPAAGPPTLPAAALLGQGWRVDGPSPARMHPRPSPCVPAPPQPPKWCCCSWPRPVASVAPLFVPPVHPTAPTAPEPTPPLHTSPLSAPPLAACCLLPAGTLRRATTRRARHSRWTCAASSTTQLSPRCRLCPRPTTSPLPHPRSDSTRPRTASTSPWP